MRFANGSLLKSEPKAIMTKNGEKAILFEWEVILEADRRRTKGGRKIFEGVRF
jgi:hypothetical protein